MIRLHVLGVVAGMALSVGVAQAAPQGVEVGKSTAVRIYCAAGYGEPGSALLMTRTGRPLHLRQTTGNVWLHRRGGSWDATITQRDSGFRTVDAGARPVYYEDDC